MLSMRECLFCDKPAKEREHAWPDWVLRAYKPELPFRKTHGPGLKDNTEDYDPKVRRVCSECNGGWMSDLETKCRRVIGPMMHDVSLYLDREAQFNLSRWAIKTSIVLGCLVREGVGRCYSREERGVLRTGDTLPAKTLVWLARYSDPDFFFAGGLMKTPAKNLIPYEGCVGTLAVGYLLLQVFHFHCEGDDTDSPSWVFSADGPWKDGLLGIHPSSSTVLWPPAISFSDDGRFPISLLANRLGGNLRW